MPKALTNARIEELSLVFKTDPTTGAEFAPRNPLAKILSVKGFFSAKAAADPSKPPFFERVSATIKAYFAPDWTPGEYPVTTDVADAIDGDGDGASDYNAIFSAIGQVYMDISSCYWIGNDEARSIAIKTAIDAFLTELDAFRSGATPKAGARHSSADKERLQKMGDHIDALQDLHGALLPSEESSQADKEEAKGDKGDGEGEDKGAPIVPVIAPSGSTAATAPLVEGATVEGAVADKAAPIDLTVAVDTAGVQAILTQITEQLGTIKADLAKQLTEHTEAVNGRIDEVLKPVTEDLAEKTSAVSKLTASVKAMEAATARKATAPGGLPRFNGETLEQSAFIAGEVAPAPVIAADTPIGEAMKILLHPPVQA